MVDPSPFTTPTTFHPATTDYFAVTRSNTNAAVWTALGLSFPQTSANCNSNNGSAAHPGGMNVVLGDASVRFVSANLTQTTWNNVCDPRDGNPMGNDW